MSGLTSAEPSEELLALRRKWAAINMQRRGVAKAFIEDFKAHAECEICGQNYDLEFHHRDPATKRYKISRMVGQGQTPKAILKEMEKCQVLCHWCHLQYHEKNGYGAVAESDRSEIHMGVVSGGGHQANEPNKSHEATRRGAKWVASYSHPLIYCSRSSVICPDKEEVRA